METKFKTGDVVIRTKGDNKGMEVHSIDIVTSSSTNIVNLTSYGTGHDPDNLRLATLEEVRGSKFEQFMFEVPTNTLNYEIY